VGTSVGNRHFGRRRIRWKVNIKMDFIETGMGGFAWIELVYDTDTIWLL
jgi:hypothetical protein